MWAEDYQRKHGILPETILQYWVDASPGAFSVGMFTKDPEAELNYITKCEKLVESGVLNRWGSRRGWYIPRRIALVEMDYVNANDNALELWLPFELSDIVELYENSIVIIAGAPNAGKALCNNTSILTQDKWKDIKDLTTKDMVWGKDGRPVDITGVFPQGKRNCYRFIFNDRSWIDSDEDHIWTIQTSYQLHKRETGHGNKNEQFGKWINLTTKQIVDRYGIGKITQKTPKIPQNAPINFKSKKIPMSPYILGLLLGDGCFRRSSTTISTVDKEIVDILICAGLKVRYSNGCDYRLLGVGKIIRKLGLFGKKSQDKYIPQKYLFNDIKTRLSLLKGLMDSDGSIDKTGKTIEYCTASKRLALDVQFLIRSLGGSASIKKSKAFYVYKGEKNQGLDRYRLYIKINIKIFQLRRKRERQQLFKKTSEKKIHEIQHIGEKETTCISTTATDGLFIAKDFIITHNTCLMLNILAENVHWGWDMHYFNSEMSAGELKKRLLKFDYKGLDDWGFKAYERAEDFQDVIVPGKKSLNVIDFLEVHDEFYIIGRKIKEIHDRLDGGVAIIALQKNPGADAGLGGFRSLEVARLALSVDYGKVKIVKAKNFRQPELNPNSMVRDFKILHGSQIIPNGDWYFV